MHMITSMARRPNASTRSEPVERSNFEVHVKRGGEKRIAPTATKKSFLWLLVQFFSLPPYVKTRSLALERSIEQQGRVIDE